MTENQRVLDAVAAAERGDGAALGALFTASHLSQRDDYQCSAPEVDLLVDLALDEPPALGARLTGGGFGGSIVALVQKGTASETATRVADRFAEIRGYRPAVLIP